MKETILQFGTGNFLRGFFDAFLDSLNKQGLYEGKAVIVSPTDSAAVEKLNAQGCAYRLLLRGIENGKEVKTLSLIGSVSRAVNPYRDFEAFLSLAKNPDLRFIVSNTTEAGIRFDPACRFTDRPAASFPGKLTQFLYARYQNGLPGFAVLACELIDDNGGELARCVRRYAEQWELGADFIRWITEENEFRNTLVDRIVTGYPKDEAAAIFAENGWNDPLLDTAEPYHLWVIEGNYENELPLQKGGCNVIWTENVAPYKKMKVRILNGAHTSLVFPSLLSGVQTVGESLKDGLLNDYLHVCLFDCILPNLDETPENRAFADAVLERFANPFIRHLWQSIALNSVSKFRARVLPTVLDHLQARGAYPEPLAFSLVCLIRYYKENEPQDDEAAVSFIKTRSAEEILRSEALWGCDLGGMASLVNESLARMETGDIREAIRWSIS